MPRKNQTTKRKYERNEHSDLGCEINPIPFGCLECPLPQCIYDDPKMFQRLRGQAHDLTVANMVAKIEVTKQAAVDMVADQLEIESRTVYRILERVRRDFPGHTPALEAKAHDVEACGCAVVLSIPTLDHAGEVL